MTQKKMEVGQTWTFDQDAVAKGFNQHVRGQLPWYDLVISSLKLLAAHYLPPQGGVMYDIGASTGNLFVSMRDLLVDRDVDYVAVEKSAEMIGQWQGDRTFETILQADALDLSYQPYDVAVLNLTLMFMPVSRRAKWFQQLRASAKPGAAILVVDRCLTNAPEALLLERLRWQHKIDTGEKGEEIVQKEMSLIGVQRPIDSAMLEPALQWFKIGAFAGWVCPIPEV